MDNEYEFQEITFAKLFMKKKKPVCVTHNHRFVTENGLKNRKSKPSSAKIIVAKCSEIRRKQTIS